MSPWKFNSLHQKFLAPWKAWPFSTSLCRDTLLLWLSSLRKPVKTNVLPEYHLVEGTLWRDINEHAGPTTSPGAFLASLPHLLRRCPLCCCSHIHCRALAPEAIAEFAEKRRNYLRWEPSPSGQCQVFGERRCKPSSSCAETSSRVSLLESHRHYLGLKCLLIIQTIKLKNIWKFYSVFWRNL